MSDDDALFAPLRDLLGARGLGDSLPRLEAAFRLAARAHAGQSRASGEPYLSHPVAVARILLEEWSVTDPDLLAAALLHDAVEDAEAVTLEVVDAEAGPVVRDLVDRLTKAPAEGPEAKAERDRRYYARLADGPPGAALVKAADRVHNLRSMAGSGWPEAKQRGYVAEAREEILPVVRPAWPGAARALEAAAGQALDRL